MIENCLSKYLYFILYEVIKNNEKLEFEIIQDFTNIYIKSNENLLKIWKFRKHNSKDNNKNEIEMQCFYDLKNKRENYRFNHCFECDYEFFIVLNTKNKKLITVCEHSLSLINLIINTNNFKEIS